MIKIVNLISGPCQLSKQGLHSQVFQDRHCLQLHRKECPFIGSKIRHTTKGFLKHTVFTWRQKNFHKLAREDSQTFSNSVRHTVPIKGYLTIFWIRVQQIQLFMQFNIDYVHSIHNHCWKKIQAGNMLTEKVTSSWNTTARETANYCIYLYTVVRRWCKGHVPVQLQITGLTVSTTQLHSMACVTY